MHRFGLFAAAIIKTGTLLGFYKGKQMQTSDPNGDSDYGMKLAERPPWIRRNAWRTEGHFVDPLHWPQMWLKFVNTADDNHPANLDLALKGEYVAIKDIDVGKELFIEHGEEFLAQPACESPCRHMYCADARAGRLTYRSN